jgi:predicted phosphohydrolase
MGKILIIAGIIMVIGGAIIHFSPKLPFLGKLPGDIVIDRGNFKFYFPITTSILISIIISLFSLSLIKANNKESLRNITFPFSRFKRTRSLFGHNLRISGFIR